MIALAPSEYYATQQGVEIGPLTFDEFRDGWSSGDFDEDTMIWFEGLEDWILPDQRLASTHTKIAAGKACYHAGQTTFARSNFPCAELVVTSSEPDMFDRDWKERWRECGGRFYGIDHRMIACKGDPVWEKLGDQDRYPDALAIPHSPFALASGLITRDIDRKESGALGLITE